MKESTFVTSFKAKLRAKYGRGQFTIKMHGSDMSGAGLPDLIVTVYCSTYYIEAKAIDEPLRGGSRMLAPGKFTPLQAHTMSNIHHAGGRAIGMVHVHGKESDYVLVFNSTLVQRAALTGLTKTEALRSSLAVIPWVGFDLNALFDVADSTTTEATDGTPQA